MKITIPKITRPIDLTGFAPELVSEGQPILVHSWINPSGDWLDRFGQLRAEVNRLAGGAPDLEALERINVGLLELWADLWSQHPDPTTHWTAADVRALQEDPANPALGSWLREQSMALMAAYREGQRKK